MKMGFECSFCGAANEAKGAILPGYREGDIYTIHDCATCRAAMASPTVSAADIYQQIYAVPEKIPGYARYAAFAHIVKEVADPLGFLSAQEECYWAVADTLRTHCAGKDISVLEVGCGMGYLTYALARHGYSRALGIDISSRAIELARERYGDFYREADVLTFARETVERFDAVVLSEVIEHLENPIEVIAAAKLLLKPGGLLICTTPNRDFGGWRNQCWATDLPPVHLWWLSERALRELGNRCGMSVSFVDFSGWNRKHYRHYHKALSRSYRTNVDARPMLDKSGNVLAGAPAHQIAKPSLLSRVKDGWQNWVYRRRFSDGWRSQTITQSPCIGAVFQQDASMNGHEVLR